MVWINCLDPSDVDPAVASPDAPAIIPVRTEKSWSPGATVTACLDEMEAVAGQLFPAWLPGAQGITTSAGAAPAAVRSLAIAHAAATGQYGPFLADLAVGALIRSGTYTRRHRPEIRAPGLARVVAVSLGRPACALLLRPPDNLDEPATLTLVQAGQWLVDHGRLAVWICGGSPSAAEGVAEVVLTRPPRGAAAAADPQPQGVVGKPHPTSRAEVLLEAALASRPWAAGRAWNHTLRPGPLVNPVRVDLVWQRERCVVEIDGDDHRAAQKFAEDRHRDVMLQLSGYAVLRFTNQQVLHDLESVLALLQQFLATRRRAGKGN